MTTLADFLLARIAEDEAYARELMDNGPEWVAEAHSFGADFPRVLAECEAKRQIAGLHGNVVPGDTIEERGMAFCADDLNQAPCPTLRALALPYANHPDYRDEWRA
jgi:hypothetical protein